MTRITNNYADRLVSLKTRSQKELPPIETFNEIKAMLERSNDFSQASNISDQLLLRYAAGLSLDLLDIINDFSDELIHEQELVDMLHERFVQWKEKGADRPEVGKEVYLTRDDGYSNKATWNGHIWHMDDDQCGGSFICEDKDVAAWIYLPEPYQEKNN